MEMIGPEHVYFFRIYSIE